MPAEDASVDHYAALQLSSTAQSAEIKTSYRKLALLYHPDRNHGNEAEANRKFQAIQAAYEVLTDATRRAKYDRARQTAGYGAAPAATATATKSAFSASTTAARAQAAAAAGTSNTAKRYTSTAGYASASAKSNTQGTAFREWATGSYASRGGYGYRDTDKEKSRSSDDDKKRRERERERSSKSHGSRAKSEFRPESPHMPAPRRSKDSTHASAYAHTFYSRTEPRSSRGRSPEPNHATRATGGLGGDSDPDSYSHRPSRPYSYKPAETERFTTLRPSSPIHEGRKSDGSRYQRYNNEPPGTYYATPDRGGERYSRHSGYTESSRKSRTSEEFEKAHVPPPSPPPEKDRDRTKFKYTFRETHETSDEESGPRSRRKSSPTPKPTRKSSSRNWGQAYAESEDDSDDGAKADDEKASDDRSFEERMAGMKFGQTKDEKLKTGSWEGLKEPTARTTMAPETPRRTPSPYGKSPGKTANSPLNEKKKVPTRSTTPSNSHPPPPPPPPQQPTAPGPGVFAFQVPPAAAEVPIPPQPAFDWRTAFAPSYSMPPPRPQFAQYQTPVYAPAPTFTPAPPPTQPSQYPFMRPASTQPISTHHKSFHKAPAISEMDLKTMFENLTPGGVPTKKSEPNLRGRRTRSKGAKPKITTKFSEMSISGNSSPVKDTASDGSRSIFGDTSSAENLKQKKEKQAEATATQSTSGPMDIDPPASPQPPLSTHTPLSAKFEPIINGKPTNAADVPLPASPMNGFYKPSATPAPSKPDPLSTFHNLANLYPINTADNFGGLNGIANLKDALPFKSQASPTVNLDGKSRDEPVHSNSQVNAFPSPPKAPTLPLPIALDATGKLDTVQYKPYWEDLQIYVNQWQEYEKKMLALLQSKLEMNTVDFKEILADVKAARAYNAKAKEEKALREEWNAQKNKFMMAIIECHQLKDIGNHAGSITPPPVQTNTSFLGAFVKSKIARMPTFTGVPGADAGENTG